MQQRSEPGHQFCKRRRHVGPHLIPFLHTTVKNFNVEELSRDKAYLGRSILRATEAVGATPLIPFKVNSVAFTPKHRRDRVWERAFHFFNWCCDDFLSRYHLRSNVENTFGVIKAKMGPSLRSKTPTAMINETLCKILAYNVTVLIHAMYTMGQSSVLRRRARRREGAKGTVSITGGDELGIGGVSSLPFAPNLACPTEP